MQTMIQTSNKNAQLEAHTVECIIFDGVGVTAENNNGTTQRNIAKNSIWNNT